MRTRPAVERLEPRITPATATLVSGVLTVDYTATGGTVEAVMATNDGSNITLTGNVTGSLVNVTASVSQIVVNDSGGGSNQSLTMAGSTAYSLANGFSSIDVETVSVSKAINVTGASTLSIIAPKNISISDGLSTVNGNLTLKANEQSPPSTGNSIGIEVNGATISSATGAITLTGRGNATTINKNYGVLINGTVSAGLSGPVTITGTSSGASGGAGVVMYISGLVKSGGGDVSITGIGKGARDNGVQTYGTISSGGLGAISVTGTAESNDGLGIFTEASITTSGGPISVIGNGGFAAESGSLISAGGLGTVTVQGISGTGTQDYNYGVSLNHSTITSSGGNVSVIGTGNGIGSANSSYGVEVRGTITAGGSGKVIVQGTGGPGSGSFNHGVAVFPWGSITSAGGPVTVTGASRNSTSKGVYVGPSSSSISTGGTGTLTIITDSLEVNSLKIRAGATGNARATIVPRTAGTKIDIGGADVLTGLPLTLGLSITEINGITAGTLQIGDTSSGTISVTSTLSRGNSTAISLTTGSSISFAAGMILSSGSIALSAGGPITQTAGTIQTTGTLSLNSPGQTATFNSLNNKAASLIIPANVTCIVNGSFDASGSVQVDGTLGGKGSVGTVTVTGTGKIAPGTSPGKLTTGNIALNSGSTFSVELNGAVAGTDYDQLVVNGTINLGGATLEGTVGFVPTTGQVFKIIDNDGTTDAVTGTFNGHIEGATVTLAGISFTISYKGGDGNDVTLTRQAPPPPTVTNLTFGDGTNQRSLVKQMVVTFSESMNFTGLVASAFALHRSGTGGTIDDVTLTANPVNGPATSVTITFSGALTEFGSLVDGLYDLTIDANKITGAGGNLDGDGVGGAGGDYVITGTTANKFFRFFGDSDGDGALSQTTDYIAFRNAFGSPSTVFDFDNDAAVDQDDFIKFRNNFGGGP